MTPAEQQAAAAKAAAEAEEIRRRMEGELQRHGQAVSGIGGRP